MKGAIGIIRGGDSLQYGGIRLPAFDGGVDQVLPTLSTGKRYSYSRRTPARLA